MGTVLAQKQHLVTLVKETVIETLIVNMDSNVDRETNLKVYQVLLDLKNLKEKMERIRKAMVTTAMIQNTLLRLPQ